MKIISKLLYTKNGLNILEHEPGQCKFCGEDSTIGITFYGPNFRYLNDGERAHAECWIEHVVDERIKEKLKE